MRLTDYFVVQQTTTDGGAWETVQEFDTWQSAKALADSLVRSQAASARIVYVRYYTSKQPADGSPYSVFAEDAQMQENAE
jgi:hypothetical protein